LAASSADAAILRARRSKNRSLALGAYPLRIFSPVLQLLLTFGLPVAFMAYFPATVLLERTAVWVFRRELRHYQSSGH